jgi:DNA-binding FadR family transcriptional regulator
VEVLARRPLKLGQQVADKIMTDIRQRGWPVGELLGTEAELMVKYGVSRATLAEAVRQVERQGAVLMRRGMRGGLIVTAPAGDTIARTVSTYLELSDVSLAEEFEALRIIEVHAYGLAARQLNPAGVARLRALIARLHEAVDAPQFHLRCMDIRIAIADLTDNPALALFLRVLISSVGRQALQVTPSEFGPGTIEMGKDLIDIVEALIAGDGPLAQGIARTHLAERGEKLAQLVANMPRATPPVDEPLRGMQNGSEKLADTVARRIRDDIAALGWPSGQKFGEESELLQRYGVSRWVFRQAIRTLEAHAILRTKRGQNGGLIIDVPDPEHTIVSAIAYLYHADFKPEDMADVWGNLMENAAQMAGQRRPADGFSSLIRAKERMLEASSRDARDAGCDVCCQLGELSGNRVLAIFIAILGRFIAGYEIKGARPRIVDAMKLHHVSIADAVIAGDGGLARRSMADFMDLMRPYYTAEEIDLPVG